jgi:hypothetical protein
MAHVSSYEKMSHGEINVSWVETFRNTPVESGPKSHKNMQLGKNSEGATKKKKGQERNPDQAMLVLRSLVRFFVIFV